MPAPPTPQAPRLRAPSWRDPRLLVGLGLVLASVVAGGRVVAAADDTVPVWAARTTLASGDALTPAVLSPVRVHLDEAVAEYLSAERPLPPGLVALRTLGPGELVPASAVGEASLLLRKPLGLPYEGPLPSGLVKGARVDVWITPAPDPGAPAVAPAGADGPVQLAQRVEVAEVAGAEDGFAGSGTTVQVYLAEEEVARVLAGRAAGAEVSLLLVPGTTPLQR